MAVGVRVEAGDDLTASFFKVF